MILTNTVIILSVMKVKKKNLEKIMGWEAGRKYKIVEKIKNNNIKVPYTMPKTYRCSTQATAVLLPSLPNIDP